MRECVRGVAWRRSKHVALTIRIEYCFLPTAFEPSSFRIASVSFSLLSLAPAYCSTTHTYLMRPEAVACSRVRSPTLVFSMIIDLHNCNVEAAPRMSLRHGSSCS